MFKLSNTSKIDEVKKEIRDTYLSHPDIPFIIGYSGGKDSTLVLQLFVEVLFDLKKESKLGPKVYVISADTLVENPLVAYKTFATLNKIKEFCNTSGLPLAVDIVVPNYDNTFFANLIGRGYPPPLQSFRWCTDRIKINPANKYTMEKVSDNGEIIMVLGTRYEESQSREASMRRHEIEGNVLSIHSSINNAWTYAPIRDIEVTDLWEYLLNNPPLWGDSNQELYELYAESSGECPLMVDEEMKKTASCGNSRFGCWVCTVVSEDKSLTGFIKSGAEYLIPLRDYRNKLIKIRDDNSKRNLFDNRGNLKLVTNTKIVDGKIIVPKKLDREKFECNVDDKKHVFDYDEAITLISEGKIDPLIDYYFVHKNDKLYRIGASGFNFDTRYELLEELIKVEIELKKHVDYSLIQMEEIIAINKIWSDSGFEKSAIDLYNSLYEDVVITKENSNVNLELLKQLAYKHNIDNQTLLQIVNNTKVNYQLTNRNTNIKFVEKKLASYKLLIRGNNED